MEKCNPSALEAEDAKVDDKDVEAGGGDVFGGVKPAVSETFNDADAEAVDDAACSNCITIEEFLEVETPRSLLCNFYYCIYYAFFIWLLYMLISGRICIANGKKTCPSNVVKLKEATSTNLWWKADFAGNRINSNVVVEEVHIKVLSAT